MDADFHAHTNYSDGTFLEFMVRGAADAGLDAIGFTDHCNVSERPEVRPRKFRHGYNLDLTYERRRSAIEAIREETTLDVYDAVEMDYAREDEAEIAAFLDEGDFDYALGSVHDVDGVNVHLAEPFRSRPEADRRRVVDEYFDDLVALVRSGLFDVAAHPDIVERNEALRGLAHEDHYRRVADAFAESRTIPEINAGRIHAEYGAFHPTSAFLDVLLDRGIDVTVGSDSHDPKQIERRVPELVALLEDRGIDPVTPFDA